jgi:hypothetical protein
VFAYKWRCQEFYSFTLIQAIRPTEVSYLPCEKSEKNDFGQLKWVERFVLQRRVSGARYVLYLSLLKRNLVVERVKGYVNKYFNTSRSICNRFYN